MGMWKSIRFDDWEKPPDGRRIGDVRRCRLARTTSKETTIAATTVDNDGPRISFCREDPRIAVIGEYAPFHRCLGSLVGKVLSDMREDPSSLSDGDMSSKAVLYDIQARVTIVINHIRLPHQVFRDDSL